MSTSIFNQPNYRSFSASQKAMWDFGVAVHQRVLDQDIHTMPRRLYSFHPARNNQITSTRVQTLEQLQEALDLNPDFTHISVVMSSGNHWLIHKGPVLGTSSTDHSRWHSISLKRLPKPIRMHLVIDPLGE